MNLTLEQKFFIAGGFFFLAFSLFLIYGSITTGDFYVGHELGLLASSYVLFCLAYLNPKLRDNDERSKRIKERGMFFSFFFIFGYMIILIAGFQLRIIHLNGYQTVSLLIALTMVTVFSSFVILSKQY
ncbi:hypothetical protein [Evansella halocellulosilytica]|uniref:hypothetical protein n=1 Tax=Evansella halocellulosilytica TaxID=2011013 RepID=UPI000BB8F2F7|nr:hypothetical protein [Evansella halocellulosilytica]